MTTTIRNTIKRLLPVLAAGCALLSHAGRAEAQEILVTGPLAGAPAVRKLRLYREGRFEFAPTISFSLLDEYQRTILIGARLNYNLTDWLAIGVWGAAGAIKTQTSLAEGVQQVNAQRWLNDPEAQGTRRLTAINLGKDFKQQLASIDWVLAPQLTLVPFRGKLAIFQSLYVDSDLYFFGGPAFVGLKERANCSNDQCAQAVFPMTTRTAIAPTFGLGFSFFVRNSPVAFSFEWRGMPFSWNTGGFDNAGADPDKRFPDRKIDATDQQFHFNQFLSLSVGVYLPFKNRNSE